jgi:hypothetical protein
MAVNRRGKNFVIDYYPEGRYGKHERITLPDSIQTEAEARVFEQSNKKAARDPNDLSLPSPASIAELIPQYLAWYKINRLPGTYADLNSALGHPKRILGEVKLSDLNVSHTNLYKQVRKAEPDDIDDSLTGRRHKNRQNR